MNELFNPEAEESLLSIFLNNPDLVFETDSLLTEMFSSVLTQTLFSTINDLSNLGYTPSIDLVKSQLISNGKIKLLGGNDEYIDWITKKDSDKSNYLKYEEAVVDSYKARKLIELSTSIKGMLGSSSDVNNILNNVRNRLDTISLSSSRNGVKKIGDIVKPAYEVIKARIENPGLAGLSTGYSKIDLVTGGHSKGELLLIAARPSMGKTAMVLNTLLRTTAPIESGYKSLLFSLEMSEQTIMDRLISIDSNNYLTDVRLGSLDKSSVERINDSLVRLRNHNIFIDTNFNSDPAYITDAIKKFHKQEKIDAVYIDYVQLAVERDTQSTHSIGAMSRALKLLAKNLNIAICLVSQLNRSCETRDDKRPILSDLRQSGNLEEDADIVVFLYRDEYYYSNTDKKGILEYIVRKNRNGPIGTVYLKFTPETNIIFE